MARGHISVIFIWVGVEFNAGLCPTEFLREGMINLPPCFHALEKEMATHSSVLAWRIPGTGEPGGLLSMGLHRVKHD